MEGLELKVLRQLIKESIGCAAKNKSVPFSPVPFSPGRPELTPELNYRLYGIKTEIDAAIWLGVSVSHSLSSSNYTTRLDLQQKRGQTPIPMVNH
jgi:phage protein D